MSRTLFTLLIFLTNLTYGQVVCEIECDPALEEKRSRFNQAITSTFAAGNYHKAVAYYDSIQKYFPDEIYWPYPHIKIAIYSYRELLREATDSLKQSYTNRIEHLYQLGLSASNAAIMNQGWTKQAILSQDNALGNFPRIAPKPVGGMESLYKYIEREMVYPEIARSMGIEGKVFVQFVIDKDGSVIAIETIKGIGFGCDQEAERLISASPNWEPGYYSGEPRYVRLVLPVFFRLRKSP